MVLIRGALQPYGLAQRKALIRYYFGTDPKTWDEISEQWGQLFYALQFDGKIKAEVIKKG
jgi:hypothetical protein